MVDFRYPSETERFRQDLRAWLDANLKAEVIEAGRRGVGDPDAFEVVRDWDRRVADAGWAAISWPVEYGGRGASLLEQLVYVEETVRARAPLPLNIIALNNIAPALMTYGTEDQRRQLLPRIRRADDIWCQGMSEPDAGSDLASLSTRATRDGDEFVVTGHKIWTSLGHRADYCQLFVRTNPEASKRKGISCLIVDLRTPGVEARPLPTLTGEPQFAELFFDSVRVPSTALLGPLDGGWQVATTTLSHERANAARLYGEIQNRLEETVAAMHAGGSIAGQGAPPCDDPVTLHRLGGLAMRATFLEGLCKRSVSAAIHGGDGLGSASLAKTVWGELGQDVATFAFDVLGPASPEGRWAERRLGARAMTIAGGTTQVNKNVTAQRVLGLPRG